MDRFGSDKPDLRFGMELTDVTDVVKNCGFSVFTGAVENGGSVRGINAKGQGGMPRKKIDKLTAFVKDYGAKGLAYIAIQEDGSIKSSFAKFMTEEEMDALIKAMGAEAGDLLLFAADKNKVVWDSLGALRVELAKQLELLDKNEFRFVWITEFPLLEWSEEQNRYVAMHHPFTMPMEEDLPLIDSDPGKVRAKAYDIVLNGNEIGGGSVRIFQDDIQEKMFEVLGFTEEQAQEQFGFLLTAFKYGVPPHAGLAYGLDRLVMIMAHEDSIRDVIAFPKNQNAYCYLSEAPNVVDQKQIDEFKRVCKLIKKSIPVYVLPGNHDLSQQCTDESVSDYMDEYGYDCFSFQVNNSCFIGLNTPVIFANREEKEKSQLIWLEKILENSQKCNHRILFGHYPFFVKESNEANRYENIPLEKRKTYLDLMSKYRVSNMFAGHLHYNAMSSYEDFNITITNSICTPLGKDRIGIRIIKVYPDKVVHDYYDLEQIPSDVVL